MRRNLYIPPQRPMRYCLPLTMVFLSVYSRGYSNSPSHTKPYNTTIFETLEVRSAHQAPPPLARNLETRRPGLLNRNKVRRCRVGKKLVKKVACESDEIIFGSKLRKTECIAQGSRKKNQYSNEGAVGIPECFLLRRV